MSDPLLPLGRALVRAEQSIALLARTQPLATAKWQRELVCSWQRGVPLRPRFVYANVPDLSELRAVLSILAREAEAAGPRGCFLAQRALELELEAQLAQTVGRPEFRSLAARRYHTPSGPLAQVFVARASEWITRFRGEDGMGTAAIDEARAVSDDPRDPCSLLCALQRALGERRLPWRVQVEDGLLADAAVGPWAVLVRPGLHLRKVQVQRIVLHEVVGHVLPYQAGRCGRDAVLLAGPAGAGEAEEGRALWLEERAGLMDPQRRFVLAVRHLAAASLEAEADFVESVRQLLALGVEVSCALSAVVRTRRGGGLNRECVYLPAWHRHAQAVGEHPQLDTLWNEGRTSLAYASFHLAKRPAGTSPRGPSLPPAAEALTN